MLKIRAILIQAIPTDSFISANMSFVLVAGAWFLSSSLLSTWANTSYVNYFHDALLHTFVRFLGSAILGGFTLLISRQVQLGDIPKLVYNVSVPAVLLWVANYANSIALQKAGITLTYVLKAGIPVFYRHCLHFEGRQISCSSICVSGSYLCRSGASVRRGSAF